MLCLRTINAKITRFQGGSAALPLRGALEGQSVPPGPRPNLELRAASSQRLPACCKGRPQVRAHWSRAASIMALLGVQAQSDRSTASLSVQSSSKSPCLWSAWQPSVRSQGRWVWRHGVHRSARYTGYEPKRSSYFAERVRAGLSSHSQQKKCSGVCVQRAAYKRVAANKFTVIQVDTSAIQRTFWPS